MNKQPGDHSIDPPPLALLGISRSSVYYAPRGERAENLALMRRMAATMLL